MNRKWAAVAVVLVVLIAHGWAGGRLVSDGLMLRPDSAEFVIGARSLLTGNGYRDLSSPDLPRLSRPIGTSLLLMPVVAVQGYDVSACRWLILATSLLAVAAVFTLATRLYGAGWATVLTVLVGLNPVVVSYSSEMISEVPFACYTVLIVVILAGCPSPVPWSRLLLIVFLAFLAEKTRSQGLAFWPALGVWAWLQTNRKRALAAVATGFACSFLFEMLPFSGSSSSARYLPYFREYYAAYGASGLFLSLYAGFEFYVGSLLAVVVPFAWPDLTLFETLQLPPWSTLLGGLVVLGSCLFGGRKSASGAVASASGGWTPLSAFLAVYLLASLFILSAWPHRMGRLGYPLVPIVAVLLWGSILTRLPKTLAAGVAALAMAVQLGCFGAWTAGHSSDKPFLTDEWKIAGNWLRENTPPYTRAATTFKYLYFVSGRQIWFTFTPNLTMMELNQQLERYGIRYARFGDWESDPILYRNPTYLFEAVPLEIETSPLWKVLPNREGTISSEPIHLDAILRKLEEDLAEGIASKDYYQLQRAQLLMTSSRLDEAEAELRDYLARNPNPSQNNSTAWMELGDVLLRAGKPKEAIDAYRQVLSGYNADFFQHSISGSIQVARAYAAVLDPNSSTQERSKLLTQLALGHAGLGRWSQLLEDSQRALELDPNNTSARGLLIYGLRRFGKFDEALDEAQANFALLQRQQPLRALRRQNADYRDTYDQVLMIHLQQALTKEEPTSIVVDGEQHVLDPSDPALYVNAAAKFRSDDLRGVALKLLEIGAQRHPDNAEIHFHLGNEYRGFGFFEESLQAFERAQALGADAKEQIENLRQVLDTVPL